MKYKLLSMIAGLILVLITSFDVPFLGPQSGLEAQASDPLYGWVEMHAHPMAHLAFGGKLLHGAPDTNILMSAIPSGNGCIHYAYPTDRIQASHEDRAIHGGWGFDNTCGDELRKAFIRGLEGALGARVAHQEEGAYGYPIYNSFPAHNDLTHQQMWVDWVHRTYQQGGLRVMVALAVNNRTLAAAVMGPGDINGDDVASANVQIEQMKRLVGQHSWMEIAYTPEDLRRIVSEDKLAIILGVEIDNIGNMQWDPDVHPSADDLSRAIITGELRNLWIQGVRYIFPIHVVDNKFGHTAIYQNQFNLSNLHQTGEFWDIACAPEDSDITHQFEVDGFDFGYAIIKLKIGIDPFLEPPPPPECSGHMNRLGLTPLGEFAIEQMMRMGMLIDIDHMSTRSVHDTLAIAEAHNYPVNAGHNGPRAPWWSEGNENEKTDDDYRRISELGGMVGLGSGDRATAFVRTYHYVDDLVESNQIAIGTDANGMVILPGPDSAAHVTYDASFPAYTDGSRTWNINTDGVAHYGLFADYVRSWRSVGMTAAEEEAFFSSAEGFAQMWEQVVVAQATLIPTPPVADAGGPYSVNEGNSVTLNAGLTSDINQPTNTLTFEWDFDNDGAFDDASGIVPNYVGPDGNALYTIRLRVTDEDGLIDTDTTTVTVNNVAPTPGITGTNTGLEGTPVSLVGSAFDPAGALDTITLNWAVTKNGNAYTSGSGAAINFTPDDNGTYVVTLVASDEDGGSNSTSHTVNVANVPPMPSITGTNTGLEGTPVALTGSAFDPAGAQDTITLNWAATKNGSNYISGSGAAINFTPDDNGIYVVTLVASDEDGGSNSTSHTVTVANVPPTAGLVLVPPLPLIQGLPAAFEFVNIVEPGSADIAAGFNFGLDCTNDGIFDVVSVSPILECTYPIAGTFTVVGRIADKDGGFSDITIMITVLSPSEVADAIGNGINQLMANGSLNGGQANALLVKLQHARERYEAGNREQAVQQLEVLLHQVETFGRTGVLTEAESAELANLINRLMMSILAGA